VGAPQLSRKREQSVGEASRIRERHEMTALDELDGLSQPLARDALLEFLGEQSVVFFDYDVNWDVMSTPWGALNDLSPASLGVRVRPT
jgi:hypothetical protein